jgi:hypothetical protein
MMNKKQYCQKMLDQKRQDIPLHLFLGGKWLFLKVLILSMGTFLILAGSAYIKILGGIAIGYALGKIAAGIMSYRLSQKTWPFMDDLINWDKVSKYATSELDLNE